MSSGKRQGNRPDRRIAPHGFLTDPAKKNLLDTIRYTGSSLHKLHPGNYGFVPPQNPRPSKSPCDEIRIILLEEAQLLFRSGIELGMISAFPEGGTPKYVWSVATDGDIYESKTNPNVDLEYHGYRLGDDEAPMRKYILKEWKIRCR